MTTGLDFLLGDPLPPKPSASTEKPSPEVEKPSPEPSAVEKPTTITDLLGPLNSEFDFKVPDSATIEWDAYPRWISDAKSHGLKLRQEHTRVTRLMEKFVYDIKARDYKAMGSNNDERDARLALVLLDDEIYQSHSGTVDQLDFAIKRNDILVDRLENEFMTKRLRFRASVVQGELLGGIPVDGRHDKE